MPPARALALLLLLPALGGCIGGDDDLSRTNLDDPASTGALPSVVHASGGAVLDQAPELPDVAGAWFGLDHQAVEPTLGITSDGAIFYTGAYWNDDGPTVFPSSHVLRSEDGGRTWEEVGPQLPTGHDAPPETGDPYLYVDEATDRVYNFDMYPPLVCSWISWSDDGGESWSQQPAACGAQQPYDHQGLTSGPAGDVPTAGYDRILYQCVNRVVDSLCSRSLDGGYTWQESTPAFQGYDPARAEVNTTGPMGPVAGAFEGFCGGLHGHLATGPDGTVYLPREYCGDAALAVSYDHGLTWETVTVAEDEASSGPDPAVTTDDAGNVYYLYVTDDGRLLLAVSEDQGRTFGEPLEVQAPNVDAAHLPTIDAGAEGQIAFAYTGTENLPDGYENPEFEDGYDESGDEAINNATWNGYIGVIEDALSEEPTIQTAYVNDPADPLVRGYCGPGRCPGMYDFIDIELSPDGRPYAAFVDACTGPCAEPGGTYEDSQGENMAFAGAVGTLASGPSLTGEGELDPLPS